MPGHLENHFLPARRAFWPVKTLPATGFPGIKAHSTREKAGKTAHCAEANRAAGQLETPKGRSKVPKLPTLQWFWSLDPATTAANGESDHGKSDPARKLGRACAWCQGGVCWALSGAYSPGLIEASNGLSVCSRRTPLSGAYSPGLIEAGEPVFLRNHERVLIRGL